MTIRSPSVSLSTPALTIDEGKTETIAIIAQGDLANAVMRVRVQVTGDALISLSQDGARIAGERQRHLHRRPPRQCEHGIDRPRRRGREPDRTTETRTATLTLIDAGGADIGDQDTLTVTVRGSTAVPVLPTIGQLLLTVLLLAGGLRLHSTRTRTARRL